MTADALRTIGSARAALESGNATPEDLLALAAGRVRQLDRGPDPIGAFLSSVDDFPARRASSPGPPPAPGHPGARSLEGVPVAVKDNLCTLRFPTTCGSRMLEGYRSPFAATAVRRLEGAGARLFGKTNLDEFAMGSSTENSAYGATRNPIDRSRVPGGSSGGSAAAVAAGVVPVALGSSTGGSVRLPAAYCGVVGVRPTYGRVSRYGLVAFASSLDQIGILARTVEDAALVLETIAGPDPRDATARDRPPPRARRRRREDLDGRVIGVPVQYLGGMLAPEVRRGVEEALDRASRGGAEIREVSLRHTEHALSCYYVIAPAEASSNLARFDGLRFGRRAEEGSDPDELVRRSRGEGLGREVKRRIMLGTHVLSAGYRKRYYRRAQRVRRAIARDFRRVFGEGIDALFAPTAPTLPFRLGERTESPYEMYRADVYTVAASLAGLPAVSLPVGNAAGLPVAGQLMCAPWEEEKMLALAGALEARIGYRHPRESS